MGTRGIVDAWIITDIIWRSTWDTLYRDGIWKHGTGNYFGPCSTHASNLGIWEFIEMGGGALRTQPHVGIMGGLLGGPYSA